MQIMEEVVKIVRETLSNPKRTRDGMESSVPTSWGTAVMIGTSGGTGEEYPAQDRKKSGSRVICSSAKNDKFWCPCRAVRRPRVASAALA